MEIEEIKKDLLFVAHYCHYEYNEIRVDVLLLDALDLINRQQEMIDALIAGQETLQKALAEKNAEIESVKKRADMWHREAELNAAELIKMQAEIERLLQKLQQPQAEAIKAFAERLKEAPIKCSYPLLGLSTKDEITDYFNNIMMQFKDAIDNLVKEMVGDAE